MSDAEKIATVLCACANACRKKADSASAERMPDVLIAEWRGRASAYDHAARIADGKIADGLVDAAEGYLESGPSESARRQQSKTRRRLTWNL